MKSITVILIALLALVAMVHGQSIDISGCDSAACSALSAATEKCDLNNDDESPEASIANAKCICSIPNLVPYVVILDANNDVATTKLACLDVPLFLLKLQLKLFKGSKWPASTSALTLVVDPLLRPPPFLLLALLLLLLAPRMSSLPVVQRFKLHWFCSSSSCSFDCALFTLQCVNLIRI